MYNFRPVLVVHHQKLRKQTDFALPVRLKMTRRLSLAAVQCRGSKGKLMRMFLVSVKNVSLCGSSSTIGP